MEIFRKTSQPPPCGNYRKKVHCALTKLTETQEPWSRSSSEPVKRNQQSRMSLVPANCLRVLLTGISESKVLILAAPRPSVQTWALGVNTGSSHPRKGTARSLGVKRLQREQIKAFWMKTAETPTTEEEKTRKPEWVREKQRAQWPGLEIAHAHGSGVPK